MIPLSLKPTNKNGRKKYKSYVCLETIGSKTPWNSIEVGRGPSGGEGSKGNFEGSVTKLHDCKQHIHPNGGGDEECNNLTWRNVDHNIG